MKVFISHSWNDKSLAADIHECLRKDGHEVWFDIHQLIPGDEIQPVIDVYIKKADVMVLIWSLYAFDSAGVEAEIQTALKMNKRIIPVCKDATPLAHHKSLEGLLGIPFADIPTGMLLLQRALLMLSAEPYKDTAWFKEAFDNVVDLGGYLNYVNTYRLKENKNEDGYKEQWAERLEKLNEKNEMIRRHLLPAAKDNMEELQSIMKELEAGNVPLEKLLQWKQWAADHESFQPQLMKMLGNFIENDIQRLQSGGAPVSSLDVESVERAINTLESGIQSKKQEAEQELKSTIKKYGGFLMGEKTIHSISSAYLSYVTISPQLLKELLNEAMLSEYVSVKEVVVQLAQYMHAQDHALETRKKNLDGFIDDAYLIHNTVKLLIEADLVAKNNFTLDFVNTHIMDNYISFLLNAQAKQKADEVLFNMRNIIGIKKKEVNWSQVAAVVLGVAAISSGVGYAGGFNPGHTPGPAGGSDTGNGGAWEDRMAAMSAKYGGGLNFYHPVQY